MTDDKTLFAWIDQIFGGTGWTRVCSLALLPRWRSEMSLHDPLPPRQSEWLERFGGRRRGWLTGRIDPHISEAAATANRAQQAEHARQKQQNFEAAEKFVVSDLYRSLCAGEHVLVCKRQGDGGDWSRATEVYLPPEFSQLGRFIFTRADAIIRQTIQGGFVNFANPVVRRAGAPASTPPPTDDQLADLIRATYPGPMPGIPDAEAELRPLIREKLGAPARADQLRELLDRDEFKLKRRKRGHP
jgi:hypothetical protein